MHVVVASHQQLPAKGYGGPQRVVVALVRGLAAHGHRITLLAPPGTRVPESKLVELPPPQVNDPTTPVPYMPRDVDRLTGAAPRPPGPRPRPRAPACSARAAGRCRSCSHPWWARCAAPWRR